MADPITCEPHFSKADTMKKMPYLSIKKKQNMEAYFTYQQRR